MVFMSGLSIPIRGLLIEGLFQKVKLQDYLIKILKDRNEEKMKSSIEVLKTYNIHYDWKTIYVGIRLDLISYKEISKYAVEYLSNQVCIVMISTRWKGNIKVANMNNNQKLKIETLKRKSRRKQIMNELNFQNTHF
ncbi:DUF2247 family protein [Bacillus pumilus]|uniref:DUF2247 family protein n=1 Tax=Bacillus pumilus TaxID=1408 RepID=UPI003ADAA78E